MCYVLCAACYANVHVYSIKCVVFNYTMYQPVELGISKLEPHYECARRCGRKQSGVDMATSALLFCCCIIHTYMYALLHEHACM